MARIKITQEGWAGFTGDIGITAFEDGVSVEHVNRRAIAIIGASLSIVEVDDEGNEGENPALQHVMLGTTTIPAEILPELPRGSETETASTKKAGDLSQVTFHSKEQLEAVSDKHGIAGLREIMEPLGLKAGSINKAIQSILKAELKLKAQMEQNGQLVRQDGVNASAKPSNEVVEGEDETEEKSPETLAAEAAAAEVAARLATEEAESKENRSDAGPGADKSEA